MTPIGPVSPLLNGASALTKIDAPLFKPAGLTPGVGGSVPTEGFGQMLDGVVAMVQSKQADAKEITQKVLLGESDQLHQSVIAMQEAGVSFSLMVEVRNKLIESYQELMRMQV